MSFPRAHRPSMTRRLQPIAAALALILSAGASQAQSLSEVYEAARAFDPTYLGARALADSAQYKAEQAHALNRPGVNLVVTGARTDADTPSSTPAGTKANTLDGKLAAQQSLFNRANDLSIEQADKGLTVSQQALRAAEQDLIVRVASAYFDVLSSTEALRTVQANKTAVTEQLASARRNFEVGNATITDTREAEARLDLVRAQEIAAQADVQVKQVTLDQLVGRAGVTPQGLSLPVTLPPVLPAQAADWVALAESDSPALTQARLAWDIAKLETDRAKAGHLPTVALGASYDRAHTSADYKATRNSGWGNSNSTNGTAQIGVTLTVPIFSGYAVQNRVKETVLLEDKARNDFEAARSGVTTGTRTAFLGAASGNAQVKALEAAEVSTKLALDATQLGYKVGVKVNIDVLNAQVQLFQTQRDLAKARYDYLLATLKLRQAAGQLKGDDLLAITALTARK